MMARASDRNLLFGVLALQMDFISRDALIASMNAWALEKNRELGEILVDRGDLDPLDRQALDAMIARRLAKHGDDPARSLAALSSVGSVADDLRRSVRDVDVLRSLSTIGPEDSADAYATRATASPAFPPAGARFRKVREHAAGNLGVVYVARDEELNREVALKEIKEKNADHPHSQAKFLLEAEVTGGLEHPGIVPVYGLGHYEDGRPFYAMRFIRGKSLLDAIRVFHADHSSKADPGARILALQKLLRRFTDVCNAVAYAHSRGVLHRDLKPDNVMVGKYGETLVVDWGLAKALGRSGDPTATRLDPEDPLPEASLQPSSAGNLEATQAGSLVGTPAYMSPEQAAGRLDLLGPGSDIYGLGATLYHLIVGRPSIEARSLGELLGKVQAGEIIRPRSVVPWLDPSLEAICLKAMALRPEARYASPRDLADDIDRWLADEPVRAHREPWPARAARWARHHRTPVVGAASLLITAVVALALSTILLGREKQQTERQRQLADRNFRKAREAADGFLTRITEDAQLAQPGLQPLRRRLLEAGVAYYEDFAREGVDPGDRARLADAYSRVARVNFLVGSREKALAGYQGALAFQDEIARARPDDPESGRQLAETLVRLGMIQLDAGQMADSRQSLDRAREVAERIQANRPDEATRRSRATAYLSLGEWHQKALERAKALDFQSKAVDLLRGLVEADPKSVRARSDLARALAGQGGVLVELLRADLALAAFDEARALREAILREDRGDADQRSQLATLDRSIAAVFKTRRNYPEALAASKRAKELREAVIADNSVVEDQEALANEYEDIGMTYRLSKQLDEAMASAEKSREIAEQLIRIRPGVPRFSFLLARSLLEVAKIQKERKQGAQARQTFEKAAEILETQVIARSGEVEPRLYLAATRESIGNLGVAVIPVDEALRSHQQAQTIRRGLVAQSPDDPAFQNALANSHNALGTLKAESGQTDQGIEDFRAACRIRSRVIDAHPDDLNTRSILGVAHFNLGLWLMKTGQAPEALESLKEAVKQERIALEGAPQENAFRDRLGIFLDRLAGLQRDMGLTADAEATALDRQNLRPDPTKPPPQPAKPTP